MKKELSNIIEENKDNNTASSATANSWISSLRRPKDFVGVRKIIFNAGTDERPNWAYGTEISPKVYEYNRKQFALVNYDKPESFTRNKSIINTFHMMNTKTQSNFSDINSINVMIILKSA